MQPLITVNYRLTKVLGKQREKEKKRHTGQTEDTTVFVSVLNNCLLMLKHEPVQEKI